MGNDVKQDEEMSLENDLKGTIAALQNFNSKEKELENTFDKLENSFEEFKYEQLENLDADQTCTFFFAFLLV